MIELKVCPSCLKEGFSTFSPYAKKHFLGGKSVSHILPYDSLTSTDSHLENKGRLSLSGAQEKYSLVINGGNFRLAEENERSTYIAKPKLTGFDNREYSPANENLTMQIASQVYGIKTAENAVCFTQNGEQVYVTKRFDIKADGSKIHQEDFASLAGISKDTNGANFKYGALDYADIAELIKKYIPAWRIELITYFDILLFNFVFANGDAHIKNFSVIQTTQGDYRLAPAYDLINTLIHIPGSSIFALEKGLYRKWNNGMGTYGSDFFRFGKIIGLEKPIIQRELDRFCSHYALTDELVKNSLLSEELKETYRKIYNTRINSFLKVME